MSTSTSTTSSNSTSSSTSTTDQYPTSGSSLGSLKYHINSMTGWYLGAPSAQELYLYSNLAIDLGNVGYYLFYNDPTVPANILFTQYSTTYADQTFSNAVSNDLTYNGSIQTDILSPTDYATQFGKLDGLMGISWFPWNVYGIKNTAGNYCVRRYYNGTDYIQADPLCGPVLEIKLVTTLKLFGIGLGVYLTGKLLYKYATKK